MRVDVFSIFPEWFAGPLEASLLGKARSEGRLDVRVHDPRDFTADRHRSVDDAPYGGGAGMVMAPGPLFDAVEAVEPVRPLLLLSAAGRRFDQAFAAELAAGPGFSLICGRYEGVDQRVADHLCDGEVSVGDFVLAGGEPAAAVVIDAVARLLPGVMGNRGVGGGGVLRRRAARVPAVHPAARVPGPPGARGAPVGGPRRGSPAGAGPRRSAARGPAGPTSSSSVR